MATQTKNKQFILISEDTYTILLTLMHTTSCTSDFTVFLIGERIIVKTDDVVSVCLFVLLFHFNYRSFEGADFNDYYNSVKKRVDALSEKHNLKLSILGWFFSHPYPESLRARADSRLDDIRRLQGQFQDKDSCFFLLLGAVQNDDRRNFKSIITAYRKKMKNLQEVPFNVYPFDYRNFSFIHHMLIQIYQMLECRMQNKNTQRVELLRVIKDPVKRIICKYDVEDQYMNVLNRFAFPALQFAFRYADIVLNFGTFFSRRELGTCVFNWLEQKKIERDQ